MTFARLLCAQLKIIDDFYVKTLNFIQTYRHFYYKMSIFLSKSHYGCILGYYYDFGNFHLDILIEAILIKKRVTVETMSERNIDWLTSSTTT